MALATHLSTGNASILSEGGQATPGHYVAHVHLANLANNWNLSPGPTAYELILE